MLFARLRSLKGPILKIWSPASVAAVACGTLVLNTIELGSTRYDFFSWIDTMAAVTLYLDREGPIDGKSSIGPEPTDAELSRSIDICRRIMTRQAERLPDQTFWRTVPAEPFLRERSDLMAIPTFHDPGRALLLAWGYKQLGGIAPHLLPWLAVFAMVPALCWAIVELWLAGFPWAATVLGGLTASSPFVVQSLVYGHSPFGFYLVAVVCVIALSAYAVRSTPSPAGVLVRAFVSGVVFAGCRLCRGATLGLAGGFLLPLVLAGSRVPNPAARVGRWCLVILAVAVQITPSILARRPQNHAVWTSFWEGLGDFDRTKGYVWDDGATMEFLKAQGLPASWVDLSSERTASFLRARIAADISSDPQWYTRILAQRLLSTVLLWKLWPRAATDGTTFAPKVWPNEGSIDGKFRVVPTVDVLALGRHRFELPVATILGPSFLFAAAALARKRLGVLEAREVRLRGGLSILTCTTLAVLTLPVLLTTAGVLEPQAIGLVYFLGFGLCLDALRPDRSMPCGLRFGLESRSQRLRGPRLPGSS